jgi:hypothetical protein
MDENINIDDTTVGKELTNENTQNDNIVVNQIQETEEIKEESITKDKRSCNTKKNMYLSEHSYLLFCLSD